MISRRAALGGLLLGGAGLATTGVFSNRITESLIFGAPAFATEPQPLAVPELVEGNVLDGVRTYDLKLQQGLSQFLKASTPRHLASTVRI